MTLEKLRENIQEHNPYVLHNDEKYVSLSRVMADIDSLEETYVVKPKVELTQAQVAFLKTFKTTNEALYMINRQGWGYPLMDGKCLSYRSGDDVEKERLTKLLGVGVLHSGDNIKKLKELLTEAVVNGYTVKEEVPLYICYLYNPNDNKKHLIVRKSNGKLYLDVNYKVLCDTFTEEEAREQLDWIIPHMERVN